LSEKVTLTSVSLWGRHWKQLRKTYPNWMIIWVKRFVRNQVQGEASGCSTNGHSMGSKLYFQQGKVYDTDRLRCRLVDDRVPADCERVPPHQWETDTSINWRIAFHEAVRQAYIVAGSISSYIVASRNSSTTLQACIAFNRSISIEYSASLYCTVLY